MKIKKGKKNSIVIRGIEIEGPEEEKNFEKIIKDRYTYKIG